MAEAVMIRSRKQWGKKKTQMDLFMYSNGSWCLLLLWLFSDGMAICYLAAWNHTGRDSRICRWVAPRRPKATSLSAKVIGAVGSCFFWVVVVVVVVVIRFHWLNRPAMHAPMCVSFRWSAPT